jgi:Glycosyl transferase family 2
MTEPDASVVIPLLDERGTGERCVRSWASRQTYPRDRYEVIAVAPGVDPGLERAVRPLLGPRDRWVVHDDRAVAGLLDAGARVARGRLLFFTEAHCEADPGCLAELARYLDETGEAGARGVSLGSDRGGLGALERAVFEDAMRREGEQDGSWNRVLVHSFAIRRDVYEEVGGYRPELGEYAHYALGIELRERGHRLGFAGGAAVHHTYDGDLRHLAPQVRDFGRGELAYCASTPSALRDRYLHETPEWTDRWSSTPAAARAALRAAMALKHSDRGVIREMARHAVVAGAGPRGAIALTHARGAASLARAFVNPRFERRLAAFHAFWRARARTGRMDWLRTNPPEAGPPEPTVAFDLAAADGPRLIGFHVRESWHGRRFRWTSPLALVEVVPPPGRWEGRLALLPIRQPRDRDRLRVAVDGRRVPHRVDSGRLRFPIDGGRARWVAFAVAALRPRANGSPDHRDLGLPVDSLELAPR